MSRRGFTLVEMVVSLALLSFVMTACASIMLLSVRALPTDRDPAQRALHYQDVLLRLAAELATAVSVKTASDDELVVSTPDPTDDTRVYQLAYAASDDSTSLLRITRQEHQIVLDDLRGLEFAYFKDPDNADRLLGARLTLRPADASLPPVSQHITFLARPTAP